ncbi:hypothetical protein QTP86_034520 [Hemibagrus guttatus]|nr:hypothetical protein QTP86_034520 [Hemibagrus guttatus]
MDRMWILLVMSVGISFAHMCDGWRVCAGGRERRDAPAVSTHAVFEQLRERSLSRAPLGPGSIRYHTLDSEKSLRSETDTGSVSHASLQEEDTGDAREKTGRIPRQAGKNVASHRARSISKANTPERADSKPAHPKRLVGPHVCGGQQCCSGWAVAPGTNRCIKPDCQPPCQNRGSCSRPHTCVCRSGYQGPRCEEVAPEQVYIHTGTSRILIPVQPGTDTKQHQSARRRPTERQASESNPKTQTPKPPTGGVAHSSGTQVRRGSPELPLQQPGAGQSHASRTVKRYPSSTAPITSNALPSATRHNQGHAHTQHVAYSNGQPHASSNQVTPAGANLTANVDRIKIVFTPMVCRRICHGGQCYNSCERGDKTTVYSENQGPPSKTHGFRLWKAPTLPLDLRVVNEAHFIHQSSVNTSGPFNAQPSPFITVFCQIPCLNGGRCIGQNECWCPSNATGKFCHLPVQNPSKPSQGRQANSNGVPNGSSHSVYTLPLSNQQASLLPSLVKVHVQHPPEAQVQIHQVARVKPGQTAETGHSVQQRSQPGNNHINTNGNGHRQNSVHSTGQNHGQNHHRPNIRQNGHVGRCFQETVDGKCGKPLPGFTKQEDCCGSVGASWGLHKCTECPRKPEEALWLGEDEVMRLTLTITASSATSFSLCTKAYAVIKNGLVECPKGYKRMNSTHCQDINECLIHGLCKHAECLNTKGSYRCTCKPGYMLDAARSQCVSDKAVSVEQASCYRSISPGSCSHPLAQKITKQICCCSRVGKAWGSACERCPLPDTDHFKEICPAGHGYTYSRSDVQITLRELEEDELTEVDSFFSQNPTYPEPPLTLPATPHYQPLPPVYPESPYHEPSVPSYPHTPARPQPPRTGHMPLQPPPVSLPEGEYKEYMYSVVEVTSNSPTYVMPDLENRDTAPINVATQVTDIDKCSLTPTICGPGQCVSVQTGYTCYCDPGYTLNALQTTCIDVNECENDPCRGKGRCVNTFGSYICQCFPGFSLLMTQNRKLCQDINECNMPNKCPNGHCINTEGSFMCECRSGFTKNQRGECEDVDECRSPGVCPSGKCVNTHGSFKCQACGPGFRPDAGRCLDINECQMAAVCTNGQCVNTEGSFTCTCNHGYQTTPDNKSCQDVDECLLPDVCAHGTCFNVPGSHRCSCNTGYQSSPDDKACVDVDECSEPSLCMRGVCVNTVGSFTCTQCEAGYALSEDRQRCEDINECLSLTCPNGICLNSEGSYSCISCPTGFTVSADGELCEGISGHPNKAPKGRFMTDKYIDECKSPDICPLAVCANSEGSYSCTTCESGYRVSSDRTCEGKGRELADMMERRKVDILCVQETRWKGSKARSIGAGFKLFYYGVDSKRNGVGVVLKEEFVRNVLEVKKVSDRVMSLKLEIEGVMLNVVSGYAPQVGCELEEKERFWSELDEVMESIPTGERVVIGADFNGHVGEGNTGDEEVMGKFGVKERNLEGQMVVDFAKRMDMGVVNTYFQKREEHRVTYKSGGRRTQVDYILCRRGNLKEISDCKVVVGESVARQHRMAVCRMTLMVCKTKRSKIEKKTKWWKLKKEECCEEFRQKLRQALGGQVVLPDDWETTAEVIRETGRKVLGVSSGRRKEDKETWWWNEEVQDSVQRKRLAKKKWDMDRTEENRQEYKELQRRVKREVSKAKQKAYEELYTRLDTREGEKDLYRLARQRDRDGKDVQQVGRQLVLMTSRWRSGSVWERQQWNF